MFPDLNIVEICSQIIASRAGALNDDAPKFPEPDPDPDPNPAPGDDGDDTADLVKPIKV